MAPTRTKRLAGRVAIVTGAGRGIGRCEALLLAQEGAKVVINDVFIDRRGEPAEKSLAIQVADEIRAAGGEARANTDSIATLEGAERLVNTAIEVFGRLDIVVNNAGNVRPGDIYSMSENDWDKVVATHLKGSFATIRFASPFLCQQRSGVIINTGSESGLGHATMANYAAAKEGIIGLTRSVARELGRFNVRCNAIRPRTITKSIQAFTGQVSKWQPLEQALGKYSLGSRGTIAIFKWVRSPIHTAETTPGDPGGRSWQRRRPRPRVNQARWAA